MKKLKSLAILSLVLGFTAFSGVAVYADNDNTVTSESIDEGVRYDGLEDVVDLSALVSENSEQVAKEEKEKIQQAKKEAEEVKKVQEQASSSTADKLISIAKSKIGSPYVYGATGPYSFDCSGFTSYVYRQMGISLPRVASSQAYAGKTVSKADLQKGDLVFFNTYGGISHVGIYIGGGSFVHASSYGSGVKISSLYESYYASRYVTASRYL